MPSSPETQTSTLSGSARHTVGIGLLLIVVVLWTASNFLASVRIILLLHLHLN